MEHSLRWADAIIFVYSIIDKASFDALNSTLVKLVSKVQQETEINEEGYVSHHLQ